MQLLLVGELVQPEKNGVYSMGLPEYLKQNNWDVLSLRTLHFLDFPHKFILCAIMKVSKISINTGSHLYFCVVLYRSVKATSFVGYPLRTCHTKASILVLDTGYGVAFYARLGWCL